MWIYKYTHIYNEHDLENNFLRETKENLRVKYGRELETASQNIVHSLNDAIILILAPTNLRIMQLTTLILHFTFYIYSPEQRQEASVFILFYFLCQLFVV